MGVDVCGLDDVQIMTDCSFDTLDDVQTCTTAKVKRIVVHQAGGPDLAVWIANSWYIAQGVTVTAKPTIAVAFVALDTIDVEGTLSVAVSGSEPSAGGFQYAHLGTPNGAGAGPGGGRAGSATSAGGGGAYCGSGGPGGVWPPGSPGAGALPDGNSDLIPLVGGSSGGAGNGYPGSGGGAIQLVAAQSIIVGPDGVVTAGGGGGGGAGLAYMADGGGSGGAILIESMAFIQFGTLAANGGGGGGEPPATDVGSDGLPQGAAAPGGGTEGGQGSAVLTRDGGVGLCPPASCNPAGFFAGGGGGAAGRIRLNAPIATTFYGSQVVHSPSLESQCMSWPQVTHL
jgi:hypothetical protein